MDRQDRPDRPDRKAFSGFDMLLGLGVLAVVAAGLPWLGQQLDQAKSARSREHAGRVAQAILDFHTEMGRWPAPVGQPVDLTILTAVPPPGHTLGAMALPPDEPARPWVDQLPVDSWGRPFVAAVYGDASTPAPAQGVAPAPDPARAGRAYPMTPPPGTTIVVVSAGRDGILQSNLDALAHSATATFRGDDTGQVLQGRGGGAGS
jgi:hypothetical protein